MDTNFGKPDTNVSNIGKDSMRTDTRSDLHSAIDKANEKIPAAAERLASQAHAGVDKMADGIERMGETLDKKGVAYKRFAESGRTYVRKSPATSVLVALAAGYAVSKLFGMRRH
jgi:ElaB/YqjD/DUF883 family membrane-anchored ribosome-binding protein